MLSKSQSRRFFLGGTILFSLIFLGLTVDTMRQIPERTNADLLSEEVRRGNHIWTNNNCMGCHTLLGEGAYYGPELTKVYDRRSEDWLKLFLKDPQAMFPGERKMTNYGFSDQEISDLIAFFKWVSLMDTNDWPPEPDLKVGVAVASASSNPTPQAGGAEAAPVAAATPDKYGTVCAGCHAIGGRGGVVGPALDTVGQRMTQAELDTWLADPQAVKPDTKMPKIPMSDAERQEIAAFLARQK